MRKFRESWASRLQAALDGIGFRVWALFKHCSVPCRPVRRKYLSNSKQESPLSKLEKSLSVIPTLPRSIEKSSQAELAHTPTCVTAIAAVSPSDCPQKCARQRENYKSVNLGMWTQESCKLTSLHPTILPIGCEMAGVLLVSYSVCARHSYASSSIEACQAVSTL